MNILQKAMSVVSLTILSLLSIGLQAQTDSAADQHIMMQDPIEVRASSIAYQEYLTSGRVLGDPKLPGLINPEDYDKTCFSYLGLIDFVATLKSNLNYTASSPYLNGYMNPLIGDLDGDGYPEIIFVTQNARDVIVDTRQKGICIFDGRTGNLIATCPYADGTAEYNFSSYHPSPGTHALVKMPGKSNVSYVIALPNRYSGTPDMTRKLVSFEIVPTKNAAGKTTNYTWNRTWISSESYNSGTYYNKPVLNIFPAKTATSGGQNVPVALVYNKIFDLSTGKLLLTLGTKMGTDAGAFLRDVEIGFNFVYDIDLDGKYDVIAGGDIYYDINLEASSPTFKTLSMANVPDGRTSVADINGDGIPDVVVLTRDGATGGVNTNIRIVTWNPNFKKINPSTGEIVDGDSKPSILSDDTYPFYRARASGSNSNVFIADIDGTVSEIKIGTETKKVKLPEVSFITGAPYVNNATNWNAIKKINGFPVVNYPGTNYCLTSFTFIDTSTNKDGSKGQMQMSFYLETNDSSNNTGFALFDFDNDGVAEICYRDERTLRIIKPSVSRYVRNDATESKNGPVLLSAVVTSYTGFESPVIADVSGSYSAEMVVAGRQNAAFAGYNGAFYSIVSPGKDKFTPALPIWNQYNFDPFKIQLDLTVPQGDAPNRLSDEYKFTRILRDNNGNITGVIEDYQPYNTSMMQAMRYTSYGDRELTVNGVTKTYKNVMEPLVFLLEAYVVSELSTEEDKVKPEMVLGGSQNYIKFTLGNRSTAQTDIPFTYPIRAYLNDLKTTSIEQSLTLGDLYTSIGTTLASGTKFTGTVAPGQEVVLYLPVKQKYGFYILRVGDDSSSTSWSFGANDQAILDQLIQDGMDVDAAGYGKAGMAYRDCYWGDQTLKASRFALFPDFSTVKAYGTTTINPWANDFIPEGLDLKTVILTQPSHGVVSKSADGKSFTYVNNSRVDNSMDKFTYSISYKDETQNIITRETTVYVYVVQSSQGSFSACFGQNYAIDLVAGPTGSKLIWRDSSDAIITTPTEISNLTTSVTYKVTPDMSEVSLANPYANATFPSVNITFEPIGNDDKGVTMKWTGKIDDKWSNPYNWVLDDGTTDGKDIDYIPNTCVDVIIPNKPTYKQDGTVNKYPSIIVEKENNIRKLYLENRALVKNLQRISYSGAFMNLNIGSNDVNRWIPYVAPFTIFYAGDLAQNDAGVQINHAYVLGANPEESYPQIQETDALLDLNIKPIAMYFKKDPVSLQFPGVASKLSLYQKDVDGTFGVKTVDAFSVSDRSAGGQFIYSKYKTNNKDEFVINITDMTGHDYVLVQNIFPAYLDLAKFQAENASVVTTQYYIPKSTDTWLIRTRNTDTLWELNSALSFSTINASSPEFIPPFTFIYMKKASGVTTNIQLKYNANTMTNANAKSTDYDF